MVMSLSRQHAATADAIDGLVELRLVLGDQVRGMDSLCLARPRSQNGLTKAIWRYAERSFCATADDQLAAGKGLGSAMAAKKRLESCGGKEAGWVTAIPSRPEYRMTSQQWRDRFAVRLGLPLPFLRAGPTSCDCHDAFTRRSGAIAQGAPGAQRPLPPGSRGRITRVPRPPVDPFGEHEQRCPFAFKLGPHNRVQLQHQRNLNRADLPTKLASVHELRSTNDPHSMKQADLLTSGLSANGNDTLLDIGRIP